MKTIHQVFATLAFCSLLPGAFAAPPQVVKAVPDNGAKDVDVTLKEFRVVFDQPMSPGGMSIVGGGPTFPKITGRPRWENDRTLVVGWRLEPEHDYSLSLNSDRFNNFRGTDGQPATPYPISFRTGKASGAMAAAEKIDPAVNRSALAALKRAIDQNYSYRDLRQVDWAARFKEFSPRLETAATPREFAELAAQLLSPAQDVHLWLTVESDLVPTFQRRAAWNVATAQLRRQLPQWQQRSPIVCSAVLEDGVRYLAINAWPAEVAELEPAFQVMTEAATAGKPLVIDVRANGGGSENSAREFAGCFVERPVVYAKDSILRDGKWSGPFDRELTPNSARPHFHGPVAVLQGFGTVSSSESFVMMMKQAPGCTLVGSRTAGCSGNPQAVELGNGVVLFVPSWKDLRLDGTCLEGEGFLPDVTVETSPRDFERNDPVLDRALGLFHDKK